MWLWLSLSLAFFASFLITPLVIRLSYRFKFLDFPARKHPAILHKKPTPRSGGVVALAGFLFSISVISLVSTSFTLTKNVLGIIISSFVIVIVGLLDDKFDINPYWRLLTNFFVVGIVVAAGVGITHFTNPFGGTVALDSVIYRFHLPNYFGFLAGPHSIVVFADLIAFFWIIWVMNALNWSSGVDGQLSGIAAITLVVLSLVSLQLVKNDPSQLTVAVVSLAAAGAFLGFLPWSFYPQKIMPGYGGATLAGFLIAVLSIVSGAKLATALLILLIPLVDSVWAVVRRLFLRRSPVWGDSFHLHHQLLRLGWSIPQVCFLYYTLTLVLGILALNFDTEEKFFAIMIIGVIIFALLFTAFVVLKRHHSYGKFT